MAQILNLKKYIAVNLLGLILFIVDRILKLYFLKNPAKILGGDFFSGLFSFQLARNSGIAFGVPFNYWLLLILTILVIFILVSFLLKAYRQQKFLEVFTLTLIIVGAISNLIDRLRFGFVIDYIDAPWFTVFNLADCLITFGVGILVLGFLKKKKTSDGASQTL
ncbi:MAG: signal peptidase II [Patescibacteria group bacterium]|jgi:signal peptidase II